ncbi:MAG: thiamine phosphate synthase [Colwellia sp.]|nr:thiamine phosphate synthase [Colwellia sp.]
MKNSKPIKWTISGSDCSGGAGIAADIKTGHGLGVEVCHLITANTVQNSQQLFSVNPTPVALLQQQVDALIKDKPPSVIKIGLLANVQQVLWLTNTLKQLKQLAQLTQNKTTLITVFDPVGQASVGGILSPLTVHQLSPLLTYIDVITPNIPEAKALAQLNNENNVARLAKKIYHDFSINSVIIKGGHSVAINADGSINGNKDYSTDYCYHQLNQLAQDNQANQHHSISYQLRSPRIVTNYSHGGGCSFASAIAAFFAHGYLIRDAFTLSKAFINQGLSASSLQSSAQQHNYYGAFEAKGWPTRAKDFPQVVSNDDVDVGSRQETKPLLNGFASLQLGESKLGLYPVIDSLYWLERLLPLGLNIIQLRVKNLAKKELEQVISQAVELAKNYKTRLFINDHWQLAIKYGAYGVHIGQEDLADADLTLIRQAGLRLGISTHGCYEFLLAQQLQPSYLAVGAIFPTKTKDMTGQIQGVDNLKQLLALRGENVHLGNVHLGNILLGNNTNRKLNNNQNNSTYIPVVAIGGINLTNAIDVLATGADSIAVVTAITEAEQPEHAVKEFKNLIG